MIGVNSTTPSGIFLKSINKNNSINEATSPSGSLRSSSMHTLFMTKHISTEAVQRRRFFKRAGSSSAVSILRVAIVLLLFSAVRINAQGTCAVPGKVPSYPPGGPIPNTPSVPGKPGGDGNSKATGPQDPNALSGPTGYGVSNFVTNIGGTFAYRVTFENAATATAPAQSVTITNNLDANLDWSTFQLNGVGFGDNNLTIPAGSQHYQTTVPMTYNGQTFNVQIEAGIHSATGQVYATFYSIDPVTGLPPASVLTGFLPPEPAHLTDPIADHSVPGRGRGQGYLTYSVSPKSTVPTGVVIPNVASIVFDGNPAVATNQVDENNPGAGTDPNKEARVTIDANVPTTQMAALPPTVPPTFTVSWSGSGGTGGSGIGTYTVYVSSDGGVTYIPWLSNTTQTSGIFTGTVGTTYSFYVGAKSNVGNVQQVNPQTASVSTLVVVPSTIMTIASPLAGGTTRGGGIFKTGDHVTVTATPYAGYTFVKWTEGGTQVSQLASYSFTAGGNRSLVANFTTAGSTIVITGVPTYGSPGNMTGVVTGVNPASYKVAPYLYIDGAGWWTKPSFATPTVPINPDGTFTVALTNPGGSDNVALIFCAALIPAANTPQQAAGAVRVPNDPNFAAVAFKERYGRTISFAGRTWAVKKSLSPVGPSVPATAINSYSDQASDVWVDGAGLHLSIHQIGGVWYSSEVILQDNLGFGTYAFKTNSRTDTMDQNAVLGMFTWDPYGDDVNSGASKNREMDIEDSRWGVPAGPNTQYVVQPFNVSGNRSQFSLPNLGGSAVLTRVFHWQPGYADFVTLAGDQPSGFYLAAPADFTYSTDSALSHYVPGSGRENIHINLWLNNASGPAAPSNGQPVEVVITGFEFTPLFPVTITTNASPTAGGTVRGGGAVNSGSSVTLFATPKPGYSFVNWTEGGNPVSGAKAIYTFAANANRTLVANFAVMRDMNGDGNADILCQNNAGQITAWHMDGTGVRTSWAWISTGPLGDWKVVGAGDYNNDGNTDILCQNDVGQINVWYMNGAGVRTSWAWISTGPLGDWRVVGTGDFNNDGNTDILCQNTAGQITAWYMDGAGNRTSWSWISTGPLGDWRVVGTGDFNNDGNTDILCQNNLGQINVWYMNGAGVRSSWAWISTGALGDWRVVGTGDYNNDGNTDILCQNNVGQITAWYMNGAGARTSWSWISTGPLGDWRVR